MRESPRQLVEQVAGVDVGMPAQRQRAREADAARARLSSIALHSERTGHEGQVADQRVGGAHAGVQAQQHADAARPQHAQHMRPRRVQHRLALRGVGVMVSQRWRRVPWAPSSAICAAASAAGVHSSARSAGAGRSAMRL